MLRSMVLTVLTIVSIAVSACQTELPIRYLVCDPLGNDCKVVARFGSWASCQRHQRFASAYCDEVSKPGHIVCRLSTSPSSISSSRCSE